MRNSPKHANLCVVWRTIIRTEMPKLVLSQPVETKHLRKESINNSIPVLHFPRKGNLEVNSRCLPVVRDHDHACFELTHGSLNIAGSRRDLDVLHLDSVQSSIDNDPYGI